MKFLSVTLAGILAYEDEVSVDLSRTSPDRNVVLIWGRNGKGKTSFITALKLLFGGIDNERMRLVGFPPVTLPPGQYVLGDRDHWIGLINRRVRRREATQGGSAVASVQATWESEGSVVTARREWSTTSTGSYAERTVVTEGDTRVTGVAARDRLADFLPPDYVGFFFFDGEDIKSLAETAERKAIDFDSLLRISFVDELIRELEEAASERRRRTLSNDEKKEFRSIQRDLDEARHSAADAAEQLRDIDEDLLNQTARLRRAETVRDNLSSGATDAQRREIEQSRKKLGKSVNTNLSDLVSGRLPMVAPVLANLPLVRNAIAALEQRLDGVGAVEQRLLTKVSTSLRQWLTEIEVDLDEQQRERIADGIGQKLDAMKRPPENASLFVSLDLDRAERVLARLTGHASGGADARQAQVSVLRGIHRDLTELAVADERLMRLRVGSDANIDRYKEAVRQIKELEEKIADLNQRKGVQAARLTVAENEQQRLRRRQDELNRLAERASKDEQEARYYGAVVEALHETRERLRRAARDEVQVLMNQRYKELVTDHALVDRIEIDDSYTMNFFDAGNRPIGRASLSSGLKQLSATALLWAMKEASGFDIPVVIDTPLGRIDRENQDNMLTRYYPALSDQVIILPTNAEIDARKKELIAARIADEYFIENSTGDSATIFPGPLEGRSDG